MFQYFTDEEYEEAFVHFEGVRHKIASHLGNRLSLEKGKILDLLAGHGFLSVELTRMFPGCSIYGTGLSTDYDSFTALKASNVFPNSVWNEIEYVQCDVTELPFEDGYFNLVANFLGLEDVFMTRGESGLQSTIAEVARVTKDDGLIEITIVEYGLTPEERVAREVWEEIGLNAVFLDREYYISAFAEHGFELEEKPLYTVRKKMTFNQAKEELEFACREAPKIYRDYDVSAISFEQLMTRFGKRIVKHGMAYYPNIRVLLFSKKP
jgi:ubiquinone/menaquinone biosynthesis C-methylase UbiE